MILDGDLQQDWKPGEKRESRVVFIGRDLDADAIREGFFGVCGVKASVILGRAPRDPRTSFRIIRLLVTGSSDLR
jgi:hypothetical protein